jgi:outer membrane biosynthesis protein TonB
MIQYLAEQLGIPTSNARILYDQWLENALNSLSNGKPVTIEGLGSFTFENNELKFAPQPSLELDVNRAYAGLEPLPEEKLAPTKFSDTDFDDPFMEIIAPKYFEPNREPDPFEPEPAFAEDPAPVVTPEPDPTPESHPEPEPEPEPEAMEPTPAEEKKPVNLMPWITAALVLIVVAVGGYYGVGFYQDWMESKLASEQAVATVPDSAAPADSAAAAAAAASTGYGLAGTPVALEGRVYGIIVHSLPVKSDSEAQCAKISPLGFRCSVVAADRNGATTYRVALGQFESNETAQAAVAQLPAEYQTPGNFFISRIQ